ncbi:hypothetical protein N7491_000023 [Penicillium cf. griseofulvum]|nr:hypothetical protein N7491_000023 [Penicillium cf. griseofulvum]
MGDPVDAHQTTASVGLTKRFRPLHRRKLWQTLIILFDVLSRSFNLVPLSLPLSRSLNPKFALHYWIRSKTMLSPYPNNAIG